MPQNTEKHDVPFGKGKTLRHLSDDPRIEVLNAARASKEMKPYSFWVSTIEHLEDAGGGRSVIVLKSGNSITLSLPYAELTDKIDEGFSPIDLKEYCDTVAPVVEPKVGDKMEDGTILAGLTADGKHYIYAMPTDLDVTLTFNDAAKSVKKLNADKSLGHNDWQIPALENVRVLQKSQNEGALKGTFKTAASRDGSDSPDWYWSSTEDRDYSSGVHGVRFSDGYEGWGHKDVSRLSCRPVRLVPAVAPSLG